MATKLDIKVHSQTL